MADCDSPVYCVTDIVTYAPTANVELTENPVYGLHSAATQQTAMDSQEKTKNDQSTLEGMEMTDNPIYGITVRSSEIHQASTRTAGGWSHWNSKHVIESTDNHERGCPPSVIARQNAQESQRNENNDSKTERPSVSFPSGGTVCCVRTKEVNKRLIIMTIVILLVTSLIALTVVLLCVKFIGTGSEGDSEVDLACNESDQHPSCMGHLEAGAKKSGVYCITPTHANSNRTTIKVWCDMATDSGGWTAIQRRQDGSVDFYRDWNDYRDGFGEVSGEFWLGNRWIHLLISGGRSQWCMRIDFEGGMFATYRNFSIGDEEDDYRLTVSGFDGNVADSLAYHNKMPFSTRDKDHDQFTSGNCARYYLGAWWYKSCYYSNLNGRYGWKQEDIQERGVMWMGAPDRSSETLYPSFVEIKIRSNRV